MKEIRSILVPVDFSEPSRAALDLALDFAKRLGASVTLLHVYGMPIYAFPEGIAFGPEVVTRIAAAAQDATQKLAEENASSGVPIVAQTAPGTPAEEIVERARAKAFDLIVIGTHGRTGLKGVLLGSVAERVVRLAPCPVLTVRAPAAR